MNTQKRLLQAVDLIESRINELGLDKIVKVETVYDPEIDKIVIKAKHTYLDRFSTRYLSNLYGGYEIKDLVDIFMNFYEKRVDWLKADKYWQREANDFNIHPEFFKKWYDEYEFTSK
tara:strand:+ start:630 stop:980 length:351 start_codon:yes stop_codon:yes gene_type:complete